MKNNSIYQELKESSFEQELAECLKHSNYLKNQLIKKQKYSQDLRTLKEREEFISENYNPYTFLATTILVGVPSMLATAGAYIAKNSFDSCVGPAVLTAFSIVWPLMQSDTIYDGAKSLMDGKELRRIRKNINCLEEAIK